MSKSEFAKEYKISLTTLKRKPLAHYSVHFLTKGRTIKNESGKHTYSLVRLTYINVAINRVSSQRTALGAYQNRLDHTINNLNVSFQNLTAANASITDVDMAKEMMTYSKYNVMNQAAVAMPAQANQLPQQVLQLLR